MEIKTSDIKPGTFLAIEAFEKLERKQHQMERAEQELRNALSSKAGREALADPEQMAAYVRITEKMRLDIALACRSCGKATREALTEGATR